MKKKPDSTAMLGGPLSIGIACTVGGALLGCIPTVLSHLVDFSGGRLRMIKKIGAPGDFIASAILGAIVGFICAWFVTPMLLRRPLRPVIVIVAPISALAVLAFSLAFYAMPGDRNSLGLLMFCSACAFVATCLVAAWRVPRRGVHFGLCAKCGYDLRGSLDIGRCPECGLRFGPETQDAHAPDALAKPETNDPCS